MKWSLVYTFFRSLNLSHLERSLFSIAHQTVKPDEYIFFENNTDYSEEQIRSVVDPLFPDNPWRFSFNKHQDPQKTSASWCQNRAIQMASNDIFILGKADCIYDFPFLEHLIGTFCYHTHYGNNPYAFVASWLYQMGYWSQRTHETVNHAKDLEPLKWRKNPRNLLKNNRVGSQEHKSAELDAPSFCTTKRAMEASGWYDEALVGWTFWQMDLQSEMHKKNIAFYIIHEFLYYHMMHEIEGPERNQEMAMKIWEASPRRKH